MRGGNLRTTGTAFAAPRPTQASQHRTARRPIANEPTPNGSLPLPHARLQKHARPRKRKQWCGAFSDPITRQRTGRLGHLELVAQRAIAVAAPVRHTDVLHHGDCREFRDEETANKYQAGRLLRRQTNEKHRNQQAISGRVHRCPLNCCDAVPATTTQVRKSSARTTTAATGTGRAWLLGHGNKGVESVVHRVVQAKAGRKGRRVKLRNYGPHCTNTEHSVLALTQEDHLVNFKINIASENET
jgi:hypothetical protein